MGMNKEITDKVYSSGEAALSYLKQNHLNNKFYHIGPPRDLDLFLDQFDLPPKTCFLLPCVVVI